MKVANFEIKNSAILAPMAGFTDLAFRRLCLDYGAGAVVTEMVSAKAIDHKNQKTNELFEIDKSDKPIGIQMFGSDPDCMARVTREVFNKEDFAFLDINMGCPMKKIIRNGDGSALMKKPKLVYEVVSAVKKASNKPVSVKLRLGFDEDNINVVEIAKICEDAGADFIAVHARTRAQMYSGKARIEHIYEVKRALSIPVIGNGDITTPEEAKNMMDVTGCDAVMVARAARGNPMLFKQIADYLSTGNYTKEYSYKERISDIKRQALMMKNQKGERNAMLQMRKHIAFYLKGIRNSAALKNQINRMTNLDDVLQVLNDFRRDDGR